jgi:acetyltransferase-like isoleucine patch superfamily enzyme
MAIRDDMDLNELQLDKELLALWKQLQSLHFKLREYTKRKYNRVNPFVEDLFEWKEKGRFFGGRNVTIYDSTTVTGNVQIGDNTWIGPFCSLDGTGKLTIGSFCSISAGVQILTHDTVKWALSGGKEPYEYSPVSIGDCCFIGTGAVILRGIRIGNHCLIGANSVVNKDIPDSSIAAGAPAEVMGTVEIEHRKVNLRYFH